MGCATLCLALFLIGCGGEGAKAPNSMETLTKNREVRVLTEALTAPFEFGDGTGVQGLGADVGEAIAKDFGMPLKWIKSRGASHLFDALRDSSAEMIIASVANDPDRAVEFDFSESYYDTGDVIAHSRAEFGITDLASLSGKNVGVAEGRPADSFMTRQTTAAGATITRYPTIDDALGALNRREIDAVVGDEILINYSVVKSYQNTNVLNTLVNKYSYAVAVRKGDAEFLKRINASIADLKSSGELAGLVEKWVGNIKEEAQQRAAGDREQDELKKSAKTINVSINKQSGSWAMDRLDGFVFVLNGANGKSYSSTPILTDGNHGNCRFATPVPPGDYSLNISILGLTAKVEVPSLAKSSLAMNMNISSTVTITFK